MMGESPIRPGIFQASPLVVVVPDISPLRFNARQLIVPVGGYFAISHAQASVFSSTSGKEAFSFFGGASRPSPQLLCPLASRSDFFHTSQAIRDLSVSRFCSSNPYALPKRPAPSPYQHDVVGFIH